MNSSKRMAVSMKSKQPRSRRSAAVGEIGSWWGGSSLGRGPRFADDAVDGFGRLGTDGEPLVGFFEVDGEIGAFDQRVIGAQLFDVSTVPTLAAIDSDDFIIGTVFGSLAVETESYGHDAESI